MNEPRAIPEPSQHGRSRRARVRAVAAVLLIGMSLSIVVAQRWSVREDRRERDQLESLTNLRRSYVETALTRYGDLLASIAAFEATSDEGEEGFRRFVETQRLDWLFGVDNAGYFVQEGSRVRVQYTAPHATRLPPGHNMFEHPRRREALRAAVDTAIPTIGPVGAVSVPEGEDNGGSELIELFIAVYDPGPAPSTVEERRARHVGWVGLSVDLEEAVAALGVDDGGIEMAVYFDDTGELLGESSPGAAGRITAADRSSSSQIGLINRPLRLATAFDPGHEEPRGGQAPLVLGLTITALAAYAVSVTKRHRLVLLERADAEHQRAELMSSRFFLAVDAAPVGVVVTDNAGNVELFNERLSALLGRTGDGPLSIFDYIHPDDRPDVVESLSTLSTGEVDRLVSERELVRHDGTRLWCRLTVAITRDEAGRPAGIVAHVQDIARERQAAEDLRSRERWFTSVVEHARDLIVLMERDGTVKWASPWVGHVFGIEAEVLRGTSVLGFIHPADRDRVADAIRRVGSGEVIEVEYRLTNQNGETMWMESTAANRLDDPDVAAIITVSRDVTKRHRTTQLLAHRAAHDALTGLCNRAEMELRMAAALSDAERDGEPVCIAFIDLDRFKELNDAYGHLAGDDALRTVAEAIKAEVRKQDVVARIGGDEMIIGMVGSDLDESVRILERIRQRLRSSIERGGDGPQVTISVGLALAEPGDDVDSLVHRADLALYESKRLGRDRVTVHGEMVDVR